jgi:hypothetical protein
MERVMKDDTDLVQKLLAHDEDVPVPPDHEQRIRAGLGHLLGGPTAPPSAPPGGSGGGAGGGGSPLGKWLATTAIVAGAAGGGFLAGRATAPIAIAPAPASSTPVVAAPPTPSPTPCAQDTNPPPPKPSASSSSSSSASAKPTGAAPSAQDAFDKEQSLLERARSALVRHDAALAEQALDECEKQFPKSRHAEERDYLRIQVTREKGDIDKTRALAKTFLTKYPQSLLKARVEQLAQ